MRFFIVIPSVLMMVEIFFMGLSIDAGAFPCESGEFETRISGNTECLLMRRYGSLEPKTLIVYIHGNASTGGHVTSHFKLAEKNAADFAADRVLAVALVRPGYPDDTGAYSSGSDNGRADNWQRPTVLEIGAVIEKLKNQFKPETTIIVGHSGGAAIAAVLLGMQPDLADAAILIGCPCDMAEWRNGRGRTPWKSEDPLKWVNQVKQTVRIVALTGSGDDTTAPGLSKTYIEQLQQRGIKAEFRLVPDAGHIDVLKSQAITDALAELLR
ncbi:MAG: alpha/beta hydrolase [Desulfobacula sp.]|jgi:pimeloyl-ACP methyl ester carboxylesterase